MSTAPKKTIPRNIKITVLGDGGVGKTAVTVQYVTNSFVETYDPTIEDSYQKQIRIADQTYKLEILDTAGQEEYHALRDQWVREGDGFVLVYSITSRQTFERTDKFYSLITRVKETAEPCVALVGNKLDREKTDREVLRVEGAKRASDFNMLFFEVTAKENGKGRFADTIKEMFEGLVGSIISKQTGGVNPLAKTKKKKKACIIL